MPISQQKIKDGGHAFLKEWEGVTFWNEFFEFFGLSRWFDELVKKIGAQSGSGDLLGRGGLLAEHKPNYDEAPVNMQVAEKMGELYDELLVNGYEHDLEILLVRLIYNLLMMPAPSRWITFTPSSRTERRIPTVQILSQFG